MRVFDVIKLESAVFDVIRLDRKVQCNAMQATKSVTRIKKKQVEKCQINFF